ncbi:chemotaxis protein CheA [Lentibacillus sp. N15]|uniref:chemotaxis protein CheA n=1 Tax=Lentibacillus songyuanensis TaxID=3136161 RepID=UPI0031B9DF74
MDTTEYLDVFIDESREHLESLYQHLLSLEKNPSEKAIIDEIFRSAHTLKGMSATMGYHDLANLTHKLENVFDGIRYDKIVVQTKMMDVLFDTVDHLTAMVDDIAAGGNGTKDISHVTAKLDAIEDPDQPIEQDIAQHASGQPDKAHSPTTVTSLNEFEISILNESMDRGFTNYEIKVKLREDCLLKGARVFMVFDVLEKLGEVIKSDPAVSDLEEENFDYSFTVLFISNYPKAEIEANIYKVSEIDHVAVQSFSISAYKEEMEQQQTIDQQKEQTPADKPAKTGQQEGKTHHSKTIRVNIDRLDALMNLFEELVIDRGRLEQISLDLNHQELKETVERMTRVSGDLQSIILKIRMVPIDQVFNRFPRMIRQLARELNKDVEINIIGAETELDRTVIDEIGDPLVHLIRNAMDHGIETPDVRRQNGKPKQGTIRLEAYHSGNHVFIEISDDGAGINKERVLHKAITNKVITKEQANSLADNQVYDLILESGFSTAETISDLSGRGVGLDVVKNTIESLGGNISIDSFAGKGSTFSIQLPLTLSIISVLLIELQEEKYAIPLSSIIETVIIHQDKMMHAHHKKVIDFRGKVIPLVFLKDIFATKGAEASEYESIVIVRKGDKLAGIVVDTFIGQQEIVLKSLGNYLTDVFAISGATILGDGQVALIVDCNSLIR